LDYGLLKFQSPVIKITSPVVSALRDPISVFYLKNTGCVFYIVALFFGNFHQIITMRFNFLTVAIGLGLFATLGAGGAAPRNAQ
jgi:hypothetical protein